MTKNEKAVVFTACGLLVAAIVSLGVAGWIRDRRTSPHSHPGTRAAATSERSEEADAAPPPTRARGNASCRLRAPSPGGIAILFADVEDMQRVMTAEKDERLPLAMGMVLDGRAERIEDGTRCRHATTGSTWRYERVVVTEGPSEGKSGFSLQIAWDAE